MSITRILGNLESIKINITSNKYMENKKTERIAVYYGDEKKTEGLLKIYFKAKFC